LPPGPEDLHVIDHLTLKVRDIAASKPFYAKALAPLGYVVAMEYEGGCGMGPKGKPDLWLHQDPENVRPTHLAFHAVERRLVDAFHAAALAAGGKDNGPPGLRPDYHANYYAAFVHDPDGHNIEAVCHAPPAERRAGARKAPARKAGGKARPKAKAGAAGGRGRKARR
jgi:catechol 2,3-dioxygenase-like lactoylglutathione lyase family enzyme